MNAKVVSIVDRRHERAILAEPDIQRAQRALGGEFGDLKLLGVERGVERYLGRDARGETVELKVLSAGAEGDPIARERFYLEAYAASKLEHINTLSTSRPEQAAGADFCVLEHKAAARTLRTVIEHDGWLDARAAARVADQIASALDHAHERAVLHLRLQPDCILIEPDGWVTLADFGIDARRGSLSSRRPRAPYASPEQASGRDVDRSSDLYSLGAVLYETLTDRTPFDSNDPEYVRQKQMTAMPAPPHLISMGVPEAVSNIVMRLLETEPAKRFQSATALQAALYDAVFDSWSAPPS